MADEKIDPLGQEFYRPLQVADKVADWLFYISAGLSLVALFVTDRVHHFATESVQIAFAIAVIALFVSTLSIRLYFFPRAQIRRYQDFLAHAFGKPVSHKQTVGYYNNSAVTPVTRVAAQLLESAFFTKEILVKMLPRERGQLGVYLVVWLLAVFNRQTNLTLIGVIAQIIFSEQLLSRFCRIEWFRWKCERIYDETFRLLRAKANLEQASWDLLGQYEITKATSAISLSTAFFEQYRQSLNSEWEEIRKVLGI
jgi:hypothetical protein